ncbi:MAG: hypothetical protein ACR2JB_11375 [Bryobacteraceae bacterium]
MEYVPDIVVMVLDHAFDRHLVAGLVITLGVAGELFAGLLASQKEGELRTTNALIIGETTERAAKAEQAAAEANLARVKLERQISDRDVSVEESNAMVKFLQPFAGQTADIEIFPFTFEAMKFFLAISTTLDKAGWHAKYIALSNPSESQPKLPVTGTSVQTTADEASLQAGKALSEAMSAVRGSGFCLMIPGLLPNTEPSVRLTIGEHPGTQIPENSVIFAAALGPVTPPQA